MKDVHVLLDDDVFNYLKTNKENVSALCNQLLTEFMREHQDDTRSDAGVMLRNLPTYDEQVKYAVKVCRIDVTEAINAHAFSREQVLDVYGFLSYYGVITTRESVFRKLMEIYIGALY